MKTSLSLASIVVLLLCAGPAMAAIGTEDYEFQTEDVVDVLATIAADEEVNIVYAPGMLTDLQGDPIQVSARLEDVRPRDAILAIISAAGLRSEMQGENIIVVKPSLEKLYSELLRRLERYDDDHDHNGTTTIIK